MTLSRKGARIKVRQVKHPPIAGLNVAPWCSGSTSAFGAEISGSNPGGAANYVAPTHLIAAFLLLSESIKQVDPIGKRRTLDCRLSRVQGVVIDIGTLRPAKKDAQIARRGVI